MRILLLVAAALLAGCGSFGATKVAVDVKPIDKPVLTKCVIDWPPLPIEHVKLVQLTGSPAVDAVLIERAKEAEIEERIAYEIKLEAAAKKCIEPPH